MQPAVLAAVERGGVNRWCGSAHDSLCPPVGLIDSTLLQRSMVEFGRICHPARVVMKSESINGGQIVNRLISGLVQALP